jgi:hypothetical protein
MNIVSETTTEFRTIKAAQLAGYKERRHYEYGGEEIVVKGKTLVRGAHVAQPSRSWRYAGRVVREDAQPHSYRGAANSTCYGDGIFYEYPIFREDQTVELGSPEAAINELRRVLRCKGYRRARSAHSAVRAFIRRWPDTDAAKIALRLLAFHESPLLDWRDGTPRKLALAVAAREADPGILADALEEAGCDEEVFLRSLRGFALPDDEGYWAATLLLPPQQSGRRNSQAAAREAINGDPHFPPAASPRLRPRPRLARPGP